MKATPLRKSTVLASPVSAVKFDVSAEKSTKPESDAKEGENPSPSPMAVKATASMESPQAADESKASETPKDDSDRDIVPSATEDPRAQPTPRDRPDTSEQPTPVETKKPAIAEITPMPATPAPAVRLAYDPSTQKKRKVGGDVPTEATLPYFGATCPEQPKRTALAVFSYLSNSELQETAGRVCHRWNRLAKEEALRQSQS